MSISERMSFINDLEIYNDPAIASATASDSAAVNGGAAVSYVANLIGQMKEDVINSTLLAQLASDKKYPGRPMNRMKEWYDNYGTVLAQVGWTVQAFNMSEIGNSNSYGSVDKLVLQLAASYLTGGELALFQRTITALTESKNVSAIQAFDRNARGSISSNDAAFQVGVAFNSGGNAMFKIGTYQYNSSDEITSVLFFKFGSSKVLFFADNQTMVLNENVYAQVRQAVLDKLGVNVWGNVVHIEI
ncbi:hypothetical protein C8Q70DRAFT_1058255 [Cubamyces menziesii]|uniref:Uncharacterized protein n=1 Tax=Trametes cubensis TaxID=1111947 RepID=A0AAD7TL84_9APHY|nr:hypothetical protein C8Q70DRAFT_1058255 [Cubamyces menziesii]KAJ8468613.1 hypothetical protein ONZ51_g9520 [Trametes cubensis]